MLYKSAWKHGTAALSKWLVCKKVPYLYTTLINVPEAAWNTLRVPHFQAEHHT